MKRLPPITELRKTRNKFLIRAGIVIAFSYVYWSTANQSVMKVRNEMLQEELARSHRTLAYPPPVVVKAVKEVLVDPDPDCLLKRSGASAEAYNKVLEGTNMAGLGYAFKAAEIETGVNALNLMSIAIHESGWATNPISIKKNNIMSICAYDVDTFNSASSYSTKMKCVSDAAVLLKRDYLTKGGKYFNGVSLEGINVKYASDKGWAMKVRQIKNDIISKLEVAK